MHTPVLQKWGIRGYLFHGQVFLLKTYLQYQTADTAGDRVDTVDDSGL